MKPLLVVSFVFVLAGCQQVQQRQEPKPKPVPVSEIGLNELADMYDANPVKAEDWLKTTNVRFSGPVLFISTRDTGWAVVAFWPNPHRRFDPLGTEVRVGFSPDKRKQVAELSKNQIVTVEGKFYKRDGTDLFFEGTSIQPFRQ